MKGKVSIASIMRLADTWQQIKFIEINTNVVNMLHTCTT